MDFFIKGLLIFGLFATAAVLGVGLFGMMTGKVNQEKQQKMMRYRVLFQALTLIMFAVLLFISKKS